MAELTPPPPLRFMYRMEASPDATVFVMVVEPPKNGLILRTLDPVPVTAVAPVPPLATGRAPVKLMVGVDPPEEARGAEADTEVTEPASGADQTTFPAPLVVRTWPTVPVPFGKVLEPMVTPLVAVRKMLRAEVIRRSP